MLNIYKKLLSILNRTERRKAFILCFLFIIVSTFEVAGVASILPLIAVLSKPELINSNHYLHLLYTTLGFTSHRSFMIFLGVAFLAILVLGLAVQALGIWGQLRFSLMRSCSWSARLFEGYLRQPYEWFLNRHSSQLTTSVVGEVRQVVGAVLLPALQIIGDLLTSIFLFILLIFADPILAISASVLLGGIYIVISLVLAKHLRKYGTVKQDSQRERHRIVNETFGGIKEVKIFGIEPSVKTKFSSPNYFWAHSQIVAGLAAQLPHLVAQGFVFGGILLILLYLIVSYGSLQQALPIIALFAFAIYRLMPNMQKIYANISTIQSNEALLHSLSEDLNENLDKLPKHEQSDSTRAILGLHNSLELQTITYSYPNETKKAINKISLTIPSKHMIGLVGASGSGKTTLIDIILGLLQPSSGNLIVDGQAINEMLLPSWQRSIGYVPQRIFLTDDTIAANIAFGVPEQKINMEKIEEVAKAANLHDFIVSQLSNGYQTVVGDKGIRLSGGQQQRLGIARALYHEPDLLVFDEATSALDNITEQAVMEAINKLGKSKTIILIAHRLTTVKKCDCIYILEHGEIQASGTYKELLSKNSHFQALAMENPSRDHNENN